MGIVDCVLDSFCSFHDQLEWFVREDFACPALYWVLEWPSKKSICCQLVVPVQIHAPMDSSEFICYGQQVNNTAKRQFVPNNIYESVALAKLVNRKIRRMLDNDSVWFLQKFPGLDVRLLLYATHTYAAHTNIAAR